MKSVHLLFATLLAILGYGTLASAKPSIAVLGLEVINSGRVQKEDVLVALRLTEALRELAKQPNGEFGFAPNSEKDLLEIKLLSGCSNEKPECMAEIAAYISADMLLYGSIERKKRNYRISLKLLNATSKKVVKTTKELVPLQVLRKKKPNKWAATLYWALVGVEKFGSISIDANVDTATVYVDGAVSTTLRSGSAKVLGLSEGTHSVMIEADGYKRYQTDLAITSGQDEALSVSLSEIPVINKEEVRDPAKLWKIGFIGGAVLTGAMAGGFLYTGIQVVGTLEQDKVDAWNTLETQDRASYDAIAGDRSGTISDSCSGTAKSLNSGGQGSASLKAFLKTCQDGEAAASRANLFMAGTAVAAVATAYLGYQGWIVYGGKSNQERAQQSKIIITPQVNRYSMGAGLSLEF